MNNLQTAVNEILNSLDQTAYPTAFLEQYDQLECLANGRGTETFLVRQKQTGRLYVAKFYDKQLYSLVHESSILKGLHHSGLPAFTDEFENDNGVCIIREYIEGKPLDRYLAEQAPDQAGKLALCLQLCDILIYLHGQENPVIHRDIKPQNIIIRPDGSLVLIDFDIARVYHRQAETDTQYFGTREYAPPEQYGFSQTDGRADIYSFGILLRFLFTGSEKANNKHAIYPPLAKIINKCTAFAPQERFRNAAALKKALQEANPAAQLRRKILLSVCLLAAVALSVWAGLRWYRAATYNPFAEGNIPTVATDAERVTDAITYLRQKFNTKLFDDPAAYADIGFVKTILTELYGYDRDYVYALPEAGLPHESEHNFLPWGMGDEQYLPRDVMAYVAVKIYWPEKVTDYTSLKDDNGVYPGVRVALQFAETNGMLSGVGRPEDISKGETAVLLANADRLFAVKAE
ncbi:MAG: serine/threonine protein kinase [Negativicutes bacterium]|nr:serine/threonine protein kinase [Negativicutes bacterium]